MTQHTHTPGPWRQGRTGDKLYANIIGGDGLLVADCGSRADLRAQANAQHIVACVNACEGINPDAVPDLLAALQFVDKWLAMRASKGDAAPSQVANSVAAAIAKATGTNPANVPGLIVTPKVRKVRRQGVTTYVGYIVAEPEKTNT